MNLDNENSNNNNIRGIQISGKNTQGKKIMPKIIREQTLWKLALARKRVLNFVKKQVQK